MKAYLTGALLLLLGATASAQTYEKNDLPCIQEFCVGDGLEQLSKVPWDRAKRNSPMTTPEYAGSLPIRPPDKKRIQEGFHGSVETALPYLYVEAFDQKALPLLAKVRSACQRTELYGTFKSAGGNPTRAKIALIPDKADPKIQRWTVVSVARDFPEAKSDTQKGQVRAQLEERYGRFSFSRGIQKGVAGMYTTHDNPLKQGSFGFDLSLARDIKDQERYRLHPDCGGSKPLTIE